MILNDIAWYWVCLISRYIYICISMFHDHSNDQRHDSPHEVPSTAACGPRLKGHHLRWSCSKICYTTIPLDSLSILPKFVGGNSFRAISISEKRGVKNPFTILTSSWILDFMQKQERFFSNIAWWHQESHRIHGAGIYANMNGVYWWDTCYHI